MANSKEEHSDGCDHDRGAEEVDGPFFDVPAEEFFRVEEAEVEPWLPFLSADIRQS